MHYSNVIFGENEEPVEVNNVDGEYETKDVCFMHFMRKNMIQNEFSQAIFHLVKSRVIFG